MAYNNCVDCHGSGLIEVESVKLLRERFDHTLKKVVTPCYGVGDWHLAQCHCVGEEDYFRGLENDKI